MGTRWILFLLCFPFCIKANDTNKLKFFDGSLHDAQNLAAQEGKLYFAEFTAKWCAPCRVLEETTFSDPQVIDYIQQHYIPVKVDIDNFDGIELKQLYNVQTIPTVLIFSSQGVLLEKYGKNLPASTMLALLKTYNTPANRLGRNNLLPGAGHSGTNSTINANAPSNQASYSVENSVSSSDDQVNPVTPFRVQNKAPDGYSIQIGAYSTYNNVLREVSRLQHRIDAPLVVYITNKSEKTTYKILIGEFASRQVAVDYHKTLATKGLHGIIFSSRS